LIVVGKGKKSCPISGRRGDLYNVRSYGSDCLIPIH
jgi:hypothetical protein